MDSTDAAKRKDLRRTAWITVALMSLAVLGVVALGRLGNVGVASSTQQQLEIATNYWLTGAVGPPATQQVVSYVVYQGYAMVNWTDANGNAGGEVFFRGKGQNWQIIEGSGGAFSVAEIAAYGVPHSIATYLLTEANETVVTPDAPVVTPGRNDTMAPRERSDHRPEKLQGLQRQRS